jgi:iron complex transport system substrate-binding protein
MIDRQAVRVASLLPSTTEMVCALGLGDRLVARSHECDFPAWVRELPAVTAPAHPLDGSSRAIDARIKALVQDGLSIYRVDPAALERLQPDVIVTQAQCEVCAVSRRDVDEAVCQLVSSRPRIVSVEATDLDGLWRDLATVADAVGERERGQALVAALQAQLAALHASVAGVARRPTVACIEWVDPLMAAGNWMPTLVELAGGTNLFGARGQHSPWLTFDALAAADPDVIILLPCGYDLRRAQCELPLLEADPRWAGLAAVRAGRVYVADGNQYFNRPGPRLVDSLAILCEILHPDRCGSGHRGHAYDIVAAPVHAR